MYVVVMGYGYKAMSYFTLPHHPLPLIGCRSDTHITCCGPNRTSCFPPPSLPLPSPLELTREERGNNIPLSRYNLHELQIRES